MEIGDMFTPSIFELKLIIQLLLSLVLGSILGLEREHLGKAAGTRTFALVAVGSTLFTVISVHGFTQLTGGEAVDISRVAASIVTGIGFLGMGLIVHHGIHVSGLTTAAGLWVAAAIGMAIGVDMYYLAIISTLLTFSILGLIRAFNIEKILRKKVATPRSRK